MARNRLAGSRTGKSKTAKFYHDNPESREKKKDYDTKYHSTKERRKYRSDLQKKNKEAGTHGNGDGKDYSHTSKTSGRMQSQSKNRADKKRKYFK